MPNKETQNWTSEKRNGVEPLKTRKVKTGETYKRRVGRKEVGTKDVYWYGLSGDGSSNYFGEAYTKPVPIYEDIYEDVPRYREEYLYPEEPKPQLVKKSSTKLYITPLDNRPHVKVPQQYKEGLATILNGLTYYKFDGYSPEQVQLAIASIIGKQQPKTQDVYYEPDESPVLNTVTEESVNLKPSAEEVVAKILGNIKKPADKEPTNKKPADKEPTNKKPEQKSVVKPVETKEVEADYIDKGVFMYKYPRREVHIYNIQPEIAELVREWLKDLTPTESGNNKQKYIYTDKPLYNLPEGFATDSVFHNIYKYNDDEYDDFLAVIDSENNIADNDYISDFSDLIRGGLYNPNKDNIFFTTFSDPDQVPVTENLVFMPANSSYSLAIPNTYKWENVLSVNYNQDSMMTQRLCPTGNVSAKGFWDQFSKKLKDTGIKTYPYNETARKIKALKKSTKSAQNTDTLKLRAKSFVSNLLNIF